jgi:hypothetical protein
VHEYMPWKGTGSSLAACRDSVIADPACANDYFIFGTGDQNCKCASAIPLDESGAPQRKLLSEDLEFGGDIYEGGKGHVAETSKGVDCSHPGNQILDQTSSIYAIYFNLGFPFDLQPPTMSPTNYWDGSEDGGDNMKNYDWTASALQTEHAYTCACLEGFVRPTSHFSLTGCMVNPNALYELELITSGQICIANSALPYEPSATYFPGRQQCEDDGLWYACGEPNCGHARACASNSGLGECACEQPKGPGLPWKGAGSTLEQCRDRVLADAECAPDYFEFRSSDQNCRCAALVSEGTDCSQASNWAGDESMLIYRITDPNATPSTTHSLGDLVSTYSSTAPPAPTEQSTEAPAPTPPTEQPTEQPTVAPTVAPTELELYSLVANGKRCQHGGDMPWKGGKTVVECRASVLADWTCNHDYFEHAGDGNCRCASDRDCSQSANQADDSNMKIYSIVNAPYELITSGKTCAVQGSGWKGSGSTLEQCRDRVLTDADCAPDYFEFMGGGTRTAGARPLRLKALTALRRQTGRTTATCSSTASTQLPPRLGRTSPPRPTSPTVSSAHTTVSGTPAASRTVVTPVPALRIQS